MYYRPETTDEWALFKEGVEHHREGGKGVPFPYADTASDMWRNQGYICALEAETALRDRQQNPFKETSRAEKDIENATKTG